MFLQVSYLMVVSYVCGFHLAFVLYGKYSASYISGKLCDVAETHPSDDTVQAYAVTALMKVFSFEKATGRNIDMLPEKYILTESTFMTSHLLNFFSGWGKER
ncbi:hypothetical protein L1987_36586 [Smallanthus sonchifolius]|uniref:Uncharacterized protein n=1 Tax=Smallanthus sonchifolius TaxID=185202 RepID=A0ACB9HGH9_9ASTR|nr:hypothetical protein L1987_36586 [Smallanthus sonchifolius]